MFSNVVGPCEESGPMIHEIKVTGNAVVGEILKAQVDYWGGTEGASLYQWTRVKDGVRKKTDLQSIDPEVIHNQDIILLPEKDPRCYVVTEDDVGAKFKGEYLSEGASIANGSSVVDISIFIPPPSFKPISLSLSRIFSVLKQPKQVLF